MNIHLFHSNDDHAYLCLSLFAQGGLSILLKLLILLNKKRLLQNRFAKEYLHVLLRAQEHLSAPGKKKSLSTCRLMTEWN